jgi:hypothetical protein
MQHPGHREKAVRGAHQDQDRRLDRLDVLTSHLRVRLDALEPVGAGCAGGRGMEQLVGWSRGATGGPVWERFLQEGYVVAVADYR